MSIIWKCTLFVIPVCNKRTLLELNDKLWMAWDWNYKDRVELTEYLVRQACLVPMWKRVRPSVYLYNCYRTEKRAIATPSSLLLTAFFMPHSPVNNCTKISWWGMQPLVPLLFKICHPYIPLHLEEILVVYKRQPAAVLGGVCWNFPGSLTLCVLHVPLLTYVEIVLCTKIKRGASNVPLLTPPWWQYEFWITRPQANGNLLLGWDCHLPALQSHIVTKVGAHY